MSLGIGKAALFQQAQHGAAAKSALRRTSALKPSVQRKVVLSESPLAVTNAESHASAVDLRWSRGHVIGPGRAIGRSCAWRESHRQDARAGRSV